MQKRKILELERELEDKNKRLRSFERLKDE